MILTPRPNDSRIDGFGTVIRNICNQSNHLNQVILTNLIEIVKGFIEGKYSLASSSIGEYVFVRFDDILVDCAPNMEGKESRFHILHEYITPSEIEEMAISLESTYEVSVQVVDRDESQEDAIYGLLIKRVYKER